MVKGAEGASTLASAAAAEEEEGEEQPPNARGQKWKNGSLGGGGGLGHPGGTPVAVGREQFETAENYPRRQGAIRAGRREVPQQGGVGYNLPLNRDREEEEEEAAAGRLAALEEPGCLGALLHPAG